MAPSFEKLLHNIRAQTSEKDFEAFSNEKNRVARFEILDKIVTTDLVSTFFAEDYGKDLGKALEFKNTGNEAFKLGQWEDALENYTHSFRLTPGRTREYGVILGNRSACLYHMKEFSAAIRDIDEGEPLFDPNAVHKLMMRKAKCLNELQEFELALEEVKRLIEKVSSNSEIPENVRKPILDEASVMQKVLSAKKSKTNHNKKTKEHALKEDWRKGEFIADTYKFDYTEEEGRYAICTSDIPVGELLLSETPFCAVVLEEYTHTHCQLCCKRSTAPIACENCADVVFCSNRCKQEATFHAFECGILKSFWRTNASVTVHLSMRMMCCYSLDFFIQIRPDLERKMTHTEIDALPSRDYRKAYALVTHEDGRTMEEMFHRSLMAKFLLNCLSFKNYLKDHENLRSYIGNLILHNIQVLQFNAHEVFELQKTDTDDIGRTMFIGGAIFPVLALFNHSCDPATVRYFDGKRVHVRTIRPLKSGEQIGENYGPIFTQNPRDERQATLSRQYKFDCGCTPCKENWPLYKDLKTNEIIRLRCKNKRCNSLIKLIGDTDDFSVKCQKCGTKLSLLEPLGYLSKLDSMLDDAKNLFKANKVDSALQSYTKLLNKLDKFMVPPFTEYHMCQQGIRRCYLEHGNVVLVKNNDKTTKNLIDVL